MQTINFLCAQHKTWLMENPARAELYWNNWSELADIDDEATPQASQKSQISHAGCAWELAGAMLHADVFCCYQALERFSRSSIQLMRLLSGAGHTAIAHNVGDACDKTLCLLITDDEKRESAQFYLQVLQLQRSKCLLQTHTH